MSSFEATLHHLPRPILDKLRAIIGRVRRLLFIRGFFATLAVGLACLLAIMGIDATVTLFSPAARWALSLSALAVTLATAWWFLIRPLSRKITLTHIARILEIRHPELQERISTAVELMSSSDPESVKGSEELIAAVVDSAVMDVNRVDPKTEFKAGRASRFMLVGGGAAAVFLLLFALWPRHVGVLAARAFAPFLDIGNAWSDTIEVKPGDVRVAIGQSVTVEMRVRHPRLRRAEIRTKLPDGVETVERMTLLGETADDGKRFSITFPSVAESFDYRIQAGSAVSEFFTVEAVPKPTVDRLTLRYDFPAYTGREPVEAASDTGEIAALAHTAVTVTAELNKPVTQAGIEVVGQPLESQPLIEGNRVKWQFPLAPKTESRWRMRFADADGFESDPADHPITALPDKAPQVRIEAPTVRELRLRPTELLPISYAVAEDIGIGQVALLVSPEGEAVAREIVQPAAASDGQPGTWRGVASLNLAALNLRPEQKRLTALIRVRDNLPADYEGPNEGLSEKLTIIIDAGAKSLAEQTLAAQKEEIRKAIEEAKQELAQAKGEAQQAERELAREEKVSTQAMRELDEFRERANEAQETLRQVAKKTEQTLFEPQGERLEQVAEKQVAEAREAADMIPVTDQKEQRVAEARTAQKQVDQAIDELKKIEKTLNEADDEMRLVADLNELANEQRQLAQQAAQQARQPQPPQPAQMAPPPLTEEQRRQMEQFRREQEQIQRELGEKLAESPEALRDILAKQQQQAAQLAEQAQATAQEQQQLQQMTETATQAAEQPDRQEALQQQLMASLEQMQQQIAAETRALREQLDQQQAEAGQPLDESSRQTREAAESLSQADPARTAGEAVQEAAEALEQAREQAEAMAARTEPQPNPAAQTPTPAAAAPQPPTPPMAQAGQTAPQPAPAKGQTPGTPPGETPAQGQPEAGKGTPPSPSQTPLAQASPPQPKPQPQPQPQPQGAEPAPAAEPAGKGELAAEHQPTPNGMPAPAAAAKAPADPAAPEAPAGQAAAPAAPPAPAQPQPPTPLASGETRRQLARLAEQQRMVAQQLQAIEAGQLDQALAQMEQQLAEQAESLQQQSQALEAATAAAQQSNAARQAAQAEGALQNAAQQAQQAQQQLAQAQEARNAARQQGQPAAPQAQQSLSQSRGQQQQAERNLGQAAQSLQQASQMLAQSLQNLQAKPEPQSDVLNPQNLAEAFNDTDQSAQSQDAQQAAQNAQQAAESLQQLAQAAMDQLGARQPNGQQPNQPGQQQQPGAPQSFAEGADPQLNETGTKTADLNGDGVPPELKALGITAADWARLKGNLQSGGAAQGGDDLPAEYRDLVGRYFQVIAREAAKAP